MKTLYIIGNGFDLHHDINCSYGNFREWLGMHYSGLLDMMDEIYGFCDGDWWSDFERNLGKIDVMGYAQQVAIENPVELASDHCDSTWTDAQIAIENKMTELKNSLQACFEEWVEQLNAPSADKQIYLDSADAKFLVFNYTRTLEELYGISESKILHIHGEAGKGETLIIGHGKTIENLHKEYPTPSDLYHQGKLDEETANSYDIHDEMAWDEMFSQVSSMQKPVEELIKQHKDFFKSIKGVKKVCVYGFSFSGVDMPYLAKTVKMAPQAHWLISCFSPKDRNRAHEFAVKYGITDYSHIRLSEVTNPMQLEIDYS